MNRRWIGFVLALLLLAIPSAAQRRRAVGPPSQPTPELGQPVAGLTSEQHQRFDRGLEEFKEVENAASGLGPIFNGRACADCHRDMGIGGDSRRRVTRFGAVVDGVFDPLTHLGGSLLQVQAISSVEGAARPFRLEKVIPPTTITVTRRTPALFGLGLVDATPDATFIALAAQQAARDDGTAGRVALVENIAAGMRSVGKFGWKAQVPTLFQFSGEAYVNEMGITNPEFPDENCANGDCTELAFNPAPGLNDNGDGVRALTDFMAMLAPPTRGPITPEIAAGERVFEQIGCGSCHVATLQSGPSDIAALDRVTYHPYSDFLLHDMGLLGDGIAQGDAGRREMRTPPLWGIRSRMEEALPPLFLHDGRAKTLTEAIEAHNGQGLASRNRFKELGPTPRQQLLAFLASL